MKLFNPYAQDPQRYVSYYQNQARGLLHRYAGAPVMYGSGLGGIFCGLFRMAVPLLKKGFNIVKPHLKTAAKNVVSEVVTNVMTTANGDRNQGGSGMLVMSCRYVKRPPGVRREPKAKKNKTPRKKASMAKKKSRGKQHRRALCGKSFKIVF